MSTVSSQQMAARQEGAQQPSSSGGANNTASGQWATIPGGKLNQALGDYSFAAGKYGLGVALGRLHVGRFAGG